MGRWWDGQWPSSQAGCYKNDVPVNDTYFEVHLLIPEGFFTLLCCSVLHVISWPVSPPAPKQTPSACAAHSLQVNPNLSLPPQASASCSSKVTCTAALIST